MTVMIQSIVSLSILAVGLFVLPQDANDASREVQQYLTRNGFTAEEIARFDGGESVAAAASPGSGEVVAIAAVKIRAPRDRVLAYYGQMISYVDGSTTLAFGRFSTPPAPGDVKDLSFDAGEVDNLRS